jgi:hypothetical protein
MLLCSSTSDSAPGCGSLGTRSLPMSTSVMLA